MKMVLFLCIFFFLFVFLSLYFHEFFSFPIGILVGSVDRWTSSIQYMDEFLGVRR